MERVRRAGKYRSASSVASAKLKRGIVDADEISTWRPADHSDYACRQADDVYLWLMMSLIKTIPIISRCALRRVSRAKRKDGGAIAFDQRTMLFLGGAIIHAPLCWIKIAGEILEVLLLHRRECISAADKHWPSASMRLTKSLMRRRLIAQHRRRDCACR